MSRTEEPCPSDPQYASATLRSSVLLRRERTLGDSNACRVQGSSQNEGKYEVATPSAAGPGLPTLADAGAQRDKRRDVRGLRRPDVVPDDAPGRRVRLGQRDDSNPREDHGSRTRIRSSWSQAETSDAISLGRFIAAREDRDPARGEIVVERECVWTDGDPRAPPAQRANGRGKRHRRYASPGEEIEDRSSGPTARRRRRGSGERAATALSFGAGPQASSTSVHDPPVSA